MSEPPREAIHHRSWDSDHQDGHSDRDWRKCSEWPCVALAASEPPSDPELRAAITVLLDRIDYINGADAREVLQRVRRALAASESPSGWLDEAWATAEAALPEGWHVHTLHLIRRPDRPEFWQAVGGDRGRYQASGEGLTAVAALHALGARLTDTAPETDR